MPIAKKSAKKTSLLGSKVKFNKVQAIALIAVVAAVGIVAFALTHAASYPAHLVLNVSGPNDQSITFLSGNNPYDGKTHDVGICGRSFAVKGSIQCDGNTIGPVSITAPVVSGYTFSYWSGCNSTSPSGASCNLQGYTNASKTITAVYGYAETWSQNLSWTMYYGDGLNYYTGLVAPYTRDGEVCVTSALQIYSANGSPTGGSYNQYNITVQRRASNGSYSDVKTSPWYQANGGGSGNLDHYCVSVGLQSTYGYRVRLRRQYGVNMRGTVTVVGYAN